MSLSGLFDGSPIGPFTDGPDQNAALQNSAHIVANADYARARQSFQQGQQSTILFLSALDIMQNVQAYRRPWSDAERKSRLAKFDADRAAFALRWGSP